MSIIVYSLVDPRNCSTRYVGVTNDMYRRYQEHILCRENNAGKNAWIKELRKENILPVMRTLEVLEVLRQAHLREKYWIAHYSSMNERLFNFECAEQIADVIYDLPLAESEPVAVAELATVRKPGPGRKFNNETVKKIIMHRLQHKKWPDDLDFDMCAYYEKHYMKRGAKYYSKVQLWRKELLAQATGA